MDQAPRTILPLVPLHQLLTGQSAETFALFTERTSGITREGKPYFQCRWKDRFRQVSVMIWAESPWFHDCEKAWILGQAYRLKVSYTHHDKYGPQCEILQWRAVTAEDKNSGFDLAHLVDSSRFHLEDLWNKLLDFVDSQIRQPAVKELIQHLYQVHAETLKSLPASDGKFYPFRGGWLEHMVSLSNTCLLLCQHYELHYSDHAIVPDRDLVLAGALLHDLGRVQEFHTDPLGILLQPTVPGKLFGHVMLSRDMVREASRLFPELSADFLAKLEHVILSHLVHPEWGSPRLPLLPEVLILHHADDLDAKLEMYLRCLNRDNSLGPFTARDPVLGKPLLKI